MITSTTAKDGTTFASTDAKTVEAAEGDENDLKATLKHWDVQASGQRLFVLRKKHTKTAGGLFIPEEAQDRQNDGWVISSGPLGYINDRPWSDRHDDQMTELEARWLSPDELDCATRRFLKPGDYINFGTHSGKYVSRKGTVTGGNDTLMVMNADDVLGAPEVK